MSERGFRRKGVKLYLWEPGFSTFREFARLDLREPGFSTFGEFARLNLGEPVGSTHGSYAQLSGEQWLNPCRRPDASGPSFIYVRCRHLTNRRSVGLSAAVYPPAAGEQPLNAGLLDLATHKACGTRYHYRARWALTPPFHPYLPRL